MSENCEFCNEVMVMESTGGPYGSTYAGYDYYVCENNDCLGEDTPICIDCGLYLHAEPYFKDHEDDVLCCGCLMQLTATEAGHFEKVEVA